MKESFSVVVFLNNYFQNKNCWEVHKSIYLAMGDKTSGHTGGTLHEFKMKFRKDLHLPPTLVNIKNYL